MAGKHTTSRISPTAHYTGYVWFRNGLSHPALETRTGRVMFHMLQPVMRVFGRFGGLKLEDLLLARHQALDLMLARAIESGEVGQVVEIAAGLSPRGYRMMKRFKDRGLVYVEGDLPDMCARKRERMASMKDVRSDAHIAVELDALLDDGDSSLARVGQRYLSDDVGTAVITEGLVNYFSTSMVEAMWARIARFLARYPSGMYASDLHVAEGLERLSGARVLTTIIQGLTRGRVHVHYPDPATAREALVRAGFDRVQSYTPMDLVGELALRPGQIRAPVHIVHATL